MEYIAGENLGNWVRRNGTLSETDALRYIKQIGEALITVHKQNLLHRDVKPQNIMRTSDGSKAILIDMGIARTLSPNTLTVTTRILAASVGYAPLEQYYPYAQRGEYTDVYALAATLYFLLTAEKPTDAKQREDGHRLVPPRQLNPNISPQVNDAILEGMNLNYKKRPQSIKEWFSSLPLPYPPVASQLLLQATLIGFVCGLGTFWLAPKFPEPNNTWLFAIGWLLFIVALVVVQYRGLLSRIPRRYSQYGLISSGTVLVMLIIADLLKLGNLRIVCLMAVLSTALSYLLMFGSLKLFPRQS